MGIILEKDIHDHDRNMYAIPASSPISIKPKADNNNAASIIGTIIMEIAFL